MLQKVWFLVGKAPKLLETKYPEAGGLYSITSMEFGEKDHFATLLSRKRERGFGGHLVRTQAEATKVLTPAAGKMAAPAGENLESVLLDWWRELLSLQLVKLDDDFFELGGHSLIGAQLFSRIDETYGLKLGLSTLFETRTVRQLAQLIRESAKVCQAQQNESSCLVPLQPRGSRTPLFWIPGGYGTSVLAFKEVSLLLGSDQPVYGFEAKMPGADEEMEDISARAARFVIEMRSFQPEGPYALIGFCGGGFVAFAMAQQLSAAGQEVAFLGIVECYDLRHPSSWSRKARFRAERAVWRLRSFLKRGPGGIARWTLERSEAFTNMAGLRARRAQARLARSAVPPLPPKPVDIYEKARRTLDHYQPVSYRGSSVVFIGKETSGFGGVSPSVDPRLIWCALSEAGSDVRVIPGVLDHMDLLVAPSLYPFAEQLKDSLLRSCPAGSTG